EIYPLPLPAGSGAGASSRALYFTASGGYVAVSMDLSTMENYLRSDDGKTRPLDQKPGLADAAEHVGGMGTGLFGYQNQRETARELFSALKSDPSVGASSLLPLGSLPFSSGALQMKDLMDFSLLPDYAQ